MAPGTVHIVVPFFADEAGRLHAGTPRRSLSRPGAIALADGLAPFYAGVLVLRDRVDRDADPCADPCAGPRAGPRADGCPEPLLVCVIGDVPGEVVKRLAA